MKFILSVTAILFLFAQLGYAQPNPPKKWRVGWYGEIDFSSINGIPYISSDTFPTEFTNAGAWDSIGNMVIHTNGIAVFNSNMDTMPGGTLEYNSTLTLPQYGSNLTQGAIILPRPGYTKQYYLFHKAYQISGATGQIYWGKLYSSVIDLNLNNGLGIITPVKNIEIEDSLWVGYINAVRHGNGRDWWLLSGRNYSNIINTWLVQSDTILGQFSQPVGLTITWPQALNQTQFSPDGSKLAIAYFEFSGNVYQFMLADFDRCTGTISNINVIQINNNDPMNSGVTGVEFSASGRFLYAGTGVYLYQFDLFSSNIQNSMTLVKVHDQFPSPFQSAFSAAKRGPDNKIYMATGSGNYGIDVINNPDSLGLACDVQLRQVNYFAQFGSSDIGIVVMPNYPDYTLGSLVGSPCDTITDVTDIYSSDTGILIYPNPATFSFSVQLPTGTIGKVSFELLDLLGRKVYEQEINNHSTTQMILLPVGIANGVYVCRLVTERKVYSEKLVVER